MRKCAIKSLAVFAITLFCSLSHAEVQPLDRVITIVEDSVITESELQNKMQQAINNIRAQGGQLPPMDVLRKQVLDHLILESIQLQMGERAGVRISDANLNEAISSIAARNNMSLEQFKQALENDGISYAEMRDNVRKEMIIARVQQGNIAHKIQITEQEVENFLASTEGEYITAASYSIDHILFPITSKTSPAQQSILQKDAQALRELLSSGKLSFEELEKQGQFNGKKLQITRLGWRNEKEIPSVLSNTVLGMQKGEVSKPIRSASGFHLVLIRDKRGGEGQIVEQTHVRHILIKPSAIRSEQQARELAASLRERALEGEDFAELAKQYSEDMGSALQGGDLGWANPGQFVPEFEQTMAKLQPGEYSQPFKTQFGWHVMQVLDRRQQDVSAARFQNQAQNAIHQRKYEEELQSWLLKIRDEAFIEYK